MIPFKWLREFIVSVANLLEAEGRALRASIIRLSVGIAGVLVAAAIVLGAAGLLVAAFVVALTAIMATAWALLIAGVILLLVAGGVGWLMVRQAR